MRVVWRTAFSLTLPLAAGRTSARVGGVESGGSGSIGVGGWRDGWMSGLESMEINLLLW